MSESESAQEASSQPHVPQQEEAAAAKTEQKEKEGDGDDDDEEDEKTKAGQAASAEAEDEDQGAAAPAAAAGATSATAGAPAAPATIAAAAAATVGTTGQQDAAVSAPLIPVVLPPKYYDKPNERRAGFIRLALDIRGVRASGLLAVGPIRIPNPLAGKSVNPGLSVEIKEKSVMVTFAGSSGELPYRYCIPELVGRINVEQSSYDTAKDLVKVYLRLHQEDLQVWAGIDRTKDYPLGIPDHVK